MTKTTCLWTGGLSNAREYGGPPFYGTVKTQNVNDKDLLMTPEDFLEKPTSKSEKLSRDRYTTKPLIYVTPGQPNTRRRKKIKYDTIFK